MEYHNAMDLTYLDDQDNHMPVYGGFQSYNPHVVTDPSTEFYSSMDIKFRTMTNTYSSVASNLYYPDATVGSQQLMGGLLYYSWANDAYE